MIYIHMVSIKNINDGSNKRNDKKSINKPTGIITIKRPATPHKAIITSERVNRNELIKTTNGRDDENDIKMEKNANKITA